MPPVKMTRAEYEAKYGKAPVVASTTPQTPSAPVKMTRAQYEVKYGTTYNPDTAPDTLRNNVGRMFVGGTVKAGKIAGDTIGASQAASQMDAQTASNAQMTQLALKKIREAKAAGRDTSKMESALKNMLGQPTQQFAENNQVVKATTGQVLGAGLQTFGDIAGAGSYGKGFLGTEQSGKLLTGAAPKLIQGTGPSIRVANALRGLGGKLGTPTVMKGAESVLSGQATKVEKLKSLAEASGVGTAIGSIYDAGAYLENPDGGYNPYGAITGAVLPAALAGGSRAMIGAKNLIHPSGYATSQKRLGVFDNLKKNHSSVQDSFDAANRKMGPDDPSAEKILSETDLLNGAVDSNGNLSAEKAHEAFNKAVEPYEATVRTELQASGDRVSIAELEAQRDKFLAESKLRGSAYSALERRLNAEIDGFKKRMAPDGTVELVDVHDAKVTSGTKNNYLDVDGPAVGKDTTRFLKEVVETKASDIVDPVTGKSTNVKAHNAGLSKMYGIRDILDALNGKKVSGGRMGKHFASLVGALAGHGAGGPLGAIFGGEGARMAVGIKLSRSMGANQKKTMKPYAGMAQSNQAGKRNTAQMMQTNATTNPISPSVTQNPRGIYPVRLSPAPPRKPLGDASRLLPERASPPRGKVIPLGGEVLGQKVDASGKLVRAPLGKSTVRAVPAQGGKPRVNPATGRMEKTYTSEVATPHKAPEMPKKLKGDARAENLHKQIVDNVKAQERAYKRGDTNKMSALKRAYNYLIKKWDALVQKVKDTPNKQGGMFDLGGLGKKKKPANSAQEQLIKEAREHKTLEDFLRKQQEKGDVLYRGTSDPYPADNQFYGDFYAHAEDYAGGADEIIDGNGFVHGFAYDRKDAFHFGNREFDDLRNAYAKSTDEELRAIYAEAIKEGRMSDAQYQLNVSNKAVLAQVKKILKSDEPYSKISDTKRNDFLTPLLQDYAKRRGKNIVSFEGSDFYGATEYVVGDTRKLTNLNDIWKKAHEPESPADRKFRRQDEETWKSRGMEVKPDGRLRNKQRGALGTPESIKNDAPVPPREVLKKNQTPLGKTKQIQFVSPNTGKLKFNEALTAMESPRQKEFRNRFEAMDKEDGLEGNLIDGMGEWGDGAENTFVKHVSTGDTELSIYNLAKKAKAAGQTDAINWNFVENGKDELYAMENKKGQTLEEIKAVLDRNGVTFKTLGEHVYIVNKHGDYFDAEMSVKIERASRELGQDFTLSNGDATFLTGLSEASDRPKSMQIYQDIIDNYEKKHGNNQNAGAVQGSKANSGLGKSPLKKQGEELSRGEDGKPRRGSIVRSTSQKTGVDFVSAGASQYNKKNGLPPVDHSVSVPLDTKRSMEIADAYDSLKNDNSSNPAVIRAYTALRDEVRKQWDYIEKEMGIKMEGWKKDGQPYANSAEMVADIKDNKHLYFFTGGEPHPFLDKVDKETGYSGNEMFRAVHDVFGHSSAGHGFGAIGEENAWTLHSKMFSPEATKALTTETRGQNSWVNFGKQNFKNGKYLNIPPEQRPYAVQKVDLLPDEFIGTQSTPLGDNHLSKAKEALREAKGLSPSDIMAKHPDINLKRDVPITDIRGNKAVIPAGEALTPYELKGNKVLLQDGETYIVSKNQWQNIKGQAVSGEAKPFAPELKGTEETVRGDNLTYKNKTQIDFEDPRWGEKRLDITSSQDRNGSDSFTVWEDDSKIFDGGSYEDAVDAGMKHIELAYPNATIDTSRLAQEPIANVSTKYSSYTLPDGKNYKEISISAPNPRVPQTFRIEESGTPSRPFRVYIGKSETHTTSFPTRAEAEAFTTKGEYSEPSRKKVPDQAGHPTGDAWIRLNEHEVPKYGNVTFLEEVQKNKNLADFKDHPWSGSKGIIPPIKRALQEAVANKSEYFAWINGEQTSARYNLATHVDDVSWEKVSTGDKTVMLNPKGGADSIEFAINADGTIGKDYSGTPADWKGKKLDEVLGKGLADSIMSKESGTLSGDGLKFGGEWANTLYDKQVKNIVEDVTGGKVIEMDLGLPVDGKGISFDRLSRYRGEGATKLEVGDIKVGDKIRENGNGNNEYVITKILGDGKFNALPKSDFDAFTRYINDGVGDWKQSDIQTSGRNESFDISTKTTTQQGIRLTPEIVARIKGEAIPLKPASGKNPFGGNTN